MEDAEQRRAHSSVFVDERGDGPGVVTFSENDAAAPFYRLLEKLRAPIAMRDMMIAPVRACYRGEGVAIDPAELPKSAAELYPQIAVSTLAIPSDAGPIRCQCFAPPAGKASRPMMLYIHGGGFVVGRSEDTAYITTRIAAENDMIVVSVNYRLAPEWRFPAALDDCMAVLRWMREKGDEIGGDRARIVAAGDSSGGNLAAVLPIRASDDGAPLQAALLFCPITDFHFERHASFERLAPSGLVIDMAFMGYVRGAYLTKGEDWRAPYASPIFADLKDYPPTLIVTGTADPLVDDNRAFAQKLREAGRQATHFVAEAMPHGFYFFPGLLEEVETAYAAIAKFLSAALAGK